MVEDRVAALIEYLANKKNDFGVRHDIAMDLGPIGNVKALDILIQIGSDINEDEIITEACGESIGEILVINNMPKPEYLKGLVPEAREAALSYIETTRPEWREKIFT